MTISVMEYRQPYLDVTRVNSTVLLIPGTYETPQAFIDPDTGGPFLDPDTMEPFYEPTDFQLGGGRISSGVRVSLATEPGSSTPIRQRLPVEVNVRFDVTMRYRLQRLSISTPHLPSIIVVDYYFRRPDTTSRYFRPDGTSYFVRA